MISRFRPSYSYRILIESLFDDYNKSEKILTEWIQDNFKTKNIFYYSFARVGLYAFLTSLGLKGGVISPAYNCIVVPDAVRYTGMTNQFADISLSDYNMTPQSFEKAIDKQSKIILATHQYGIPCDIESFRKIAKKNNLLLFEDAAAALGAKIDGKMAGRFGDVSLISFQDTKTINAVNGGCLIVHNKNLAEKMRKTNLDTSISRKISYFKKGFVYRLATEPLIYKVAYEYFTRKSKAFTLSEGTVKDMPKDYLSGLNSYSLSLIVKQLKKMEKIVISKNKIADIYLKKIDQKKISLPKINKGVVSCWERFPIRLEDKVTFFKKMSKKGIDLAWTFNYTCPKELGLSPKTYPMAIEASRTMLNLPIYPDLALGKAEKIARSVNECLL